MQTLAGDGALRKWPFADVAFLRTALEAMRK
jgi:hypothetical protein